MFNFEAISKAFVTNPASPDPPPSNASYIA